MQSNYIAFVFLASYKGEAILQFKNFTSFLFTVPNGLVKFGAIWVRRTGQFPSISLQGKHILRSFAVSLIPRELVVVVLSEF